MNGESSNRYRRNHVGRGNRRIQQRQGQRQLAPPPPAEEIVGEQRRAISNSFGSSELSYSGSDTIVSVPHGEKYEGAWKRMIKKGFLNQHQLRRFITSCIVDAKKAGYELNTLIEELGSSNGLERIKEIVKFPTSVDAGKQPHIASFQRVTLPFLALLIREGIIECTFEKEINAIYSIIYNNLDSFVDDSVMSRLQELVTRRDVTDQRVSQNELLADDPNAFIPTSIGQFFLVVVRLVKELLKRIKAASSNETVCKIAEKIRRLKDELYESFQQQLFISDPLTSDEKNRDYFFLILKKEIDDVNNMLGRINNDSNLLVPKTRKIENSKVDYYKNMSRLADLQRIYDPPGELSSDGKRHDNDCDNISEISIVPTKQETICQRQPYLPSMIEDDSIHHLPKGVARLLDRQFRLLREDMLNDFRLCINGFIDFLRESSENSTQMQKLKNRGRYRHNNQGDNSDLNVYTEVKISDVVITKYRGFSCRVSFTPPNAQRTRQARKAYWEKSKKLSQGNMVCLLWPNEDISSGGRNPINAAEYSIYFGTVAERNVDLLSKEVESAQIDINFIDLSIFSIAMKDIDILNKNASGKSIRNRFMVESTDLLFESFKNILKILQESKPESFPFAKYLAPRSDEDITGEVADVEPPTYTMAPGFRFDLSVLLDDKNMELHLNTVDEHSRSNATECLEKHGKLDKTQSQALVSALSREVALIEGPPGTGKSYIGVQIMRTLLAEKNRKHRLGPIITITYTNHALDSFLQSLLDQGISNIVRMGTRSKSEAIMKYQIDEIRKRGGFARGPREVLRSVRDTHVELNYIQKRAEEIINSKESNLISWEHASVTTYLQNNYPSHYQNFVIPNIPHDLLEDEDDEWQTARRKKKKMSILGQWIHGTDLTRAEQFKSNLVDNEVEKAEGNTIITDHFLAVYIHRREDHQTTRYPDVCGVQSNVFFIDHRNPEDPSKNEHALQSHSNQYEVEMVVEMVKYFIRNGYSKSEQIAVLTPYLGQMIKIRDALSGSFVVVIDDRDNDAITDFQDSQDDNADRQNQQESESVASRKSLTQQVLMAMLLTNFSILSSNIHVHLKGEEADIVIISLVRNTANAKDRGSIGFLKSKNRTNVLLSRARQGMYLIGNAELMGKRSKMWDGVIGILRSRQPPQVGEGFPTVCALHPDYKNIISRPEQFKEVSPDGGCTLPCSTKLNFGICGEKCPSSKFCVMCAPDDVKGQVVDERLTFAKVDWNNELMVVLDCDHVFTAKMLDRVMEMENFYQDDGLGNWVTIKPIVGRPVDLKRCPYCFKPIMNICRYGRVIRKHILDTQNSKFLVKLGSKLKQANTELKFLIDKLEKDRKEFIKKLKSTKKFRGIPEKSNKVFNHSSTEITLQERFKELQYYYLIPPSHEKLWNMYVQHLLDFYLKLSRLISDAGNPPYKLAYGAAVSSLQDFLHRSEKKSEMKIDELIGAFESLEISVDNSSHFRESLEEVGIVTPKIERRIYLDAFLKIVHVQKVLFHEVSLIIAELKSTKNSSSHYKNWLKFSAFLEISTKNHLKRIINTASETHYKRHSVLSSLELAEFSCTIWIFKLKNNVLSKSSKLGIKKRITGECDKIERICFDIQDSLRKLGSEDFERKCHERIIGIHQDIQKLRVAAEDPEQLAEKEKLQIHEPICEEFYKSDRWRQCPRGHPYTVGECGPLMRNNRCPDCGEFLKGLR
ncbi:3900_t:CDS:10 [Acaulospora colombiana]|uniref:3900_t:CDS:1 n=1 Tax=Acaulospora colombiana TaxID=27376 RepID=A0ACA9L5Q8_9GLOM|nr:3900_t:CDS:10 [Acaulospora colombiana]